MIIAHDTAKGKEKNLFYEIFTELSLQSHAGFSIMKSNEMEVPCLEENERDDILDNQTDDTQMQPAEDDAVQENPAEQVTADDTPQAEEAMPEDADPPAEAADEDAAPDEGTPAKTIKGPGAMAWVTAIVMMGFGLMMLIPSIWNQVLTIPAVSGLISEATGRYDTALSFYGTLSNSDATAQSLGLQDLFSFGSSAPSLTSGNFAMERQLVIWGKLYGPIVLQQQQIDVTSDFPEGRIPRGVKKIAAQTEIIESILDAWYAQMETNTAPAEGQTEGEWVLALMDSARAADEKAEENQMYYDILLLLITLDYEDQEEANLERIAALKAYPDSELWMYSQAEMLLAPRRSDYAAVVAACDERLDLNREDTWAMQYRVKALFLNGELEKALDAADSYAKISPVIDMTMQLTRAELYYRQGDYDKAIALCDDLIGQAEPNLQSPANKEAAAMQAVAIKGTVLMLQGNMEEAVELLDSAWDEPYSSPSMIFVYTSLAAYIATGDTESADSLTMQLQMSGYSEPPRAITDLQEGNATIKTIFTEGWGGFDA